MHYGLGTLLEDILDGIARSGGDPDELDADSLATVEEFHTFGPAATAALAEAVGITNHDRVLDVGCGIGGPARTLARSYGCTVTGLDLTEEFCEAARDLNRRARLDDRIDIRNGNALELPFVDGEFSVVWTQHVSMNIEDKTRFYDELRRVVPSDGRLAFFDILAGPNEPIHFPVPWANDPTTSHLASALETQAMVAAAGFRTRSWEDLTAQASKFYAESASIAAAGDRPLGIHLLISDAARKLGNLRRNAEEGRIIVVRCIADAV